MRYNTYQSNAYPRRSPSRNQLTQKPRFGKRLIEEFLTQLTICVIVMVIIFGAKLLKLTNINDRIAKVQTIITYSPSLKEITEGAKEAASMLTGRMAPNEETIIENEEIPMIIVDDEIF